MVKIKKILCSADALPFKNNYFDKIIFTDVQEHIPSDIEVKVVKEMFRVLKPGGMVYVEFPGSIIPVYTGLYIINIILKFTNILFNKNLKIHGSPRDTKAHINVKYPRYYNKIYSNIGFVGKMKPKTIKFFSIESDKLRSFYSRIVNMFPINYLFSCNISGKLYKPI